MILTVLGVMKILEIGKTAALTYARMNGPGKDEDDELLAMMLDRKFNKSRTNDEDVEDNFDDIYEEINKI